MEKQKSRTAQFILFNTDFRARPLPWEDETFYPEEDENGFAVFTGPESLAKSMCSLHPDRYRLYRTRPLDAQRYDANGASEWIKLHPWLYRKVTKRKVIDDPQSEVITVFEWAEDKSGASAVNHDGDRPVLATAVAAQSVAPLGDSDKKMDMMRRHFENEFERVATRIAAMETKIGELRSEIDALYASATQPTVEAKEKDEKKVTSRK